MGVEDRGRATPVKAPRPDGRVPVPALGYRRPDPHRVIGDARQRTSIHCCGVLGPRRRLVPIDRDSRRAGHHRQRALLPLGTVAPGMRRDRDHREQDPALPAPNKRQDRAIPPDPLRGMGLHSGPGPQEPNGPAPTPGSCISTITTDPTEHSAGQPQPASSRTTSPVITPSDPSLN